MKFLFQLTWHTAAEFVGEFRDEVVVDAVLERTEDNDGSCVLYGELLDCLVRQHVFFAACNCQYKVHSCLPATAGFCGRKAFVISSVRMFLHSYKQLDAGKQKFLSRCAITSRSARLIARENETHSLSTARNFDRGLKMFK